MPATVDVLFDGEFSLPSDCSLDYIKIRTVALRRTRDTVRERMRVKNKTYPLLK